MSQSLQMPCDEETKKKIARAQAEPSRLMEMINSGEININQIPYAKRMALMQIAYYWGQDD